MKIAAFYENMKDGFRAKGLKPEEGIRELHACGLDLIYAEYHHLAEDASWLMPLLQELGMGIEGTFGFFDFGHKPEDESYKEMLDMTAKCGGTNALLVPGFIFPEDEANRQEQIDNMIHAMTKATAYGKEVGVAVTIEDFDGFPSPLCSIAGCKEFLDAIPELRMSFDSGNFCMYCEDSCKAFDLFRDRFVTMHVKDRIRTPLHPGDQELKVSDGSSVYSCRIGAGYIEIEKMIRRLMADGYQGNLIAELYNTDPEFMVEELKNSIRWIRTIIES